MKKILLILISLTVTLSACSGVISDIRGTNNIYMVDKNASSSDFSNTLIHEFAHAIGVPDHYHEIVDEDGTEECLNEALCYICSDNGRSQYCIMGDNHQLIHGLCSDCQVDMFLHLAEHHTITEA